MLDRPLLRRATSVVSLVTGLTLLLVGLGLAVLLGPDGAWTATATVPAGRSAVLLEPSLVSVLGPRIGVSATGADGRPLFVGRARSDDALGYLSGTARARVTGLGTDRRLSVVSEPGTQALVAPQATDVWQQTGTGRLTWRPTPGAQSVVVTAADAGPLPAVAVTLTWRREGWIWVPVALILAGGLVTALPTLARRVRARSRQVTPPALETVDA